MSHADKAVEVLNRALEADRETVSSLLLHMFRCNKRMSEDFTLTTWQGDYIASPWINGLAVINALFRYGTAPIVDGPVTAAFNLTGPKANVLITKFALTPVVEEEPEQLSMVDHALMVLNLLLNDDATAITQLMERRIPCTQALADDPTIQVSLGEDEVCRVGMLGIINGLLGIDERGYGPITMTIENDVVTSFARTDVPPPSALPIEETVNV